MQPRSRLKSKRPSDMLHLPKVEEITSKKFYVELFKNHKSKLYWVAGILAAIILLIPIFTYIYFAGDLKDKNSITNRNKTGLTLTDEANKTFFTFYQPKEVTYIPFSEVPLVTQQAVIAAEDKNFYNNPGFSITGMGRAFIRNLQAGAIVEGGSTITQELVKNALLNSSRNVLRKYQELVLATELNRRFSKQDILEMYLNSVYFGEGAFGIENAAQAYFGIHAKDLSLAQSALLVGILPAPSAYSPLSNDPKYAEAKQRQVLAEMVEEKYITQAQADAAATEKLVYNPALKDDTNTLAPHFALYVKDMLIKKYGEERVIREGFTVRTTLNSTWQEYAERAVKNRITAISSNDAGNGAAIALDPATGDIKVMVGSYDWHDETWGKANMALHPRQPGSSFKPIIYAEALEQKLITPATILHDNPTSFGNYKPLNYDKRFRGEVTARRALANSLNIPAVEVMNMVGVSDGINAARKLGITSLKSEQNYGLSLVLGTGEVKLLEMANAYAVFANEGVYHESKAILEIRNKYGREVDTQKKSFWSFLNPVEWFNTFTTSQSKQVISNETAFLISSMLSDNKARAEVFGGALTLSRPAAVKTGTTEDYRDALTIGYTPSLVVGVWVGNNDNTPMDNIAGSLGAAPIWRNMMERFLMGTPVEEFRKPSTIVSRKICPARRANDPASSASASLEYFRPGTEPSQDCETPTPTTQPTATDAPTNASETPTDTPTPASDDKEKEKKNQPTTPPIPSPTPLPTSITIPTPTEQLDITL